MGNRGNKKVPQFD